MSRIDTGATYKNIIGFFLVAGRIILILFMFYVINMCISFTREELEGCFEKGGGLHIPHFL